MCVCSELGRVKRLSHTLHLCFFCVLLETLELKEPIMDAGAGGRPAAAEVALSSALGRGSVREPRPVLLPPSTDSDAEL